MLPLRHYKVQKYYMLLSHIFIDWKTFTVISRSNTVTCVHVRRPDLTDSMVGHKIFIILELEQFYAAGISN